MMQSLLSIDPGHPSKSMDRVFPHFITYAMPMGISGLVIAGIMAATMSSVDSGVNSLTTVAIVDFYKRFFHRPWKGERHYLVAARIGTAVIGVSATAAAFFVGQLGTILEITGKISGFLVGPIVGMFLLGVLTKRANTPGVFLGTLAGLGLVAWVATRTDVFWLWYSGIGLASSTISGLCLSLCLKRWSKPCPSI
jgi:Na+/proline symporter